MRVLVVEDDEILRDGLAAGLRLEGMTVDTVEDCEDARAALPSGDYEAVVLDIALPDGSGLDLLREWRRQGVSVPILLLTARNFVEDRVEGLDRGADDYLGKPFDLIELAARLRALQRRALGRAVASIQVGALEIDPALRRVTIEGKEIPLSRREFAVLEVLAEKPGHVISRSQIEDRIYGWQEEVGSNAVEVHIHNLRTKLGPGIVETVRGVGYRIARR